jgi:hypothetical protein
MDYPQDFSRQAKARVEAARVRAKHQLILSKGTKVGPMNPAGPALDYVAAMFYAYSQEACELGRLQIWDVDRVDKEIRKVIPDLVSEAEIECRDFGIDPPIFDLISGPRVSIHFWSHFKRMPAWSHYQLWLGEVAKIQASDDGEVSELPKDTKIARAKSPVLSKRATWLKDRLRERAWNKHDVQRYSGPDYKTVQKVLDGKPVREDGLEKLVTALNKKKEAPTVKLSDIPND